MHQLSVDLRQTQHLCCPDGTLWNQWEIREGAGGGGWNWPMGAHLYAKPRCNFRQDERAQKQPRLETCGCVACAVEVLQHLWFQRVAVDQHFMFSSLTFLVFKCIFFFLKKQPLKTFQSYKKKQRCWAFKRFTSHETNHSYILLLICDLI